MESRDPGCARGERGLMMLLGHLGVSARLFSLLAGTHWMMKIRQLTWVIGPAQEVPGARQDCRGPVQSHVDSGADLSTWMMDSSLLHREDHRDPHPRVWHRDSHDGHCGHGPGPPAHPQSAAHSCPHRELPPQRQREHVGRCWLAIFVSASHPHPIRDMAPLFSP